MKDFKSSSHPIANWEGSHHTSSQQSNLPSYSLTDRSRQWDSFPRYTIPSDMLKDVRGSSLSQHDMGFSTRDTGSLQNSQYLSNFDFNKEMASMSTSTIPEDLNEGFCEDYSKSAPKNQRLISREDSSPMRGGLEGVKLLDSQLMKDRGYLSTTGSSPDPKSSEMEEEEDKRKGSGASMDYLVSSGMPNLGNTCYMNSVLQCLFNTDRFSKHFLAGEHLLLKSDCPLTESFTQILSSAFTKQADVEDLTGPLSYFKSTLEKVAPIFEGYSQNDAHEFFRLLIEKMHDELNQAPLKTYPYTEFKPSRRAVTLQQTAEEWKKYSRDRDNSIITSAFGGTLINEVVCLRCSHRSYTFEDALDLSVNLPGSTETSSSIPDHVTSLHSCLKDYATEERVEDFACSKCKKRNTSVKRTMVWERPEILTVQFKRFVYDMYGDRRAAKDKISFPLDDLDLSVCTHPHSTDRKGKYKLYAIVNHFGGLDNGHYIAFIYNEHLKCWLQYNDSTVTRMDDKEIQEFAQGSSEPYVLFYKKV